MSQNTRDLSALRQEQFDVAIIGGGISGAWLALHCAQYGYKTALIEKYDYASQTSSSSSKLLHGGVRYLQQMQFGKARESAMERAEFLFAAPHLSTPVPFVVPTYKNFQRSKLFLNCGMLVYRALCLGENSIIGSIEQQLPPIKSISASELNDICDLGDTDHTGAVVIPERHMLDSERMVLAILQTARKLGAQVHNYVSATSFLGDASTVTGINAKDELSGNSFEIDSKLVINAAGPWIDNLNTELAGSESAPSINGFAVGSHIVTRQLCDHAIALTTKHQSNAKIDRGGRHVFIIPWRGYSLIGTSYDEIDGPNGDISVQPGHIAQLLEAINDGMPGAKLTRDDIISGYSGLYLLRTDNIQSTVYQGSGEYQIIDHSTANNVSGIVTALGAKFTTGRKLSELTMKLVNDKLSSTAQGAKQKTASKKIARCKLLGSDYQSLSAFTKQKQQQYQARFSADTIEYLIMLYGSELDAFIDSLSSPELEQVICAKHRDIFGQIVWAMEKEQALSLNDVLFNRTSLGLLGISEPEIAKVAALMAKHLGWSTQYHQQQVQAVTTQLQDLNRTINCEL